MRGSTDKEVESHFNSERARMRAGRAHEELSVAGCDVHRGLLAEVIARVESASGQANYQAERLESAADRVFSPIPQTDDDNAKTQMVPENLADRLHHALHSLDCALNRIDQHANRLMAVA